MRGDREARVGYKNPPLHTRWAPGCLSPNPSGRPKGSKNTCTLITEKLNGKIAVRDGGGRTRKMSRRELGIAKLINRFAETGDANLLLKLHSLEEGLKSRSAETQPEGREEGLHEGPTQTDADIIEWFLKRSSTAPGRDEQ